ncbi:ammonium transporter [Petroclostridium sp. X23]|uniref:ammonium transporter n=1 Tax=Petroclostridium sp. X23 TaxID=3045146 RepID=UPI0024AE590A|nr:ammonium transporter [Petroclostridium sp. X23]WHH61231.1 ammonium transporter [Petroclostridium sp. X23]
MMLRTMKLRMILMLVLSSILILCMPVAAFAAEGPTPESNAVAIDTVWVMIAAFLVFLMHAGFTCVEAGFTQSKNTVNIIMKNVMTISIGVVAYYLIGFALMFGPDIAGLIGAKGFALTQRDLFDFGIPLDAFWFFQAVFAATCATIVSGAMAERTKFSAYLFFCILICSVTYPVIGHWIWGGGWLSNLGFIDFAGSTVVHGVGGVTALIGAWMVGARTGKYTQDGKVHAIPGHSIPLGALGVLLLWFGWFGFNPGSTISGTTPDIASIAVTTLLAGAAATITSMLFSWVKYGKPDVSLTLNGCLAGLVAITAGTAAVTPNGALVIGGIAGVLMILAVEFFDRVAKIDDPVGAISVHGVCGSFGTIMVGLFAKEGGLLYGGGIKLLGVQTLGVTAALGFAAVMGLIVFGALKATIGIRVSEEEESNGLDIGEHGISAYTDPSSTANIF